MCLWWQPLWGGEHAEDVSGHVSVGSGGDGGIGKRTEGWRDGGRNLSLAAGAAHAHAYASAASANVGAVDGKM